MMKKTPQPMGISPSLAVKAVAAVLALATVAFPISTLAAQNTESPIIPMIIGGDDVAEGEFPFIVSLQQAGQHWCTGTLVDRYTVLTARHCTSPVVVPLLTAVMGRTHVSGPGGEERSIASVINHPDYDASLLILSEPVDTIRPVKLPAVGSDHLIQPGAIGTASGWGVTDNDFPETASRLQKVNVPIYSADACEVIHDDGFDRQAEICAGSRGKGACYGDSGGPLLRVVGDEITQVGVVSRGRTIECAAQDGGVVYVYTGSSLLWQGFPLEPSGP
jgi:secreted trypsin-like serine protease